MPRTAPNAVATFSATDQDGDSIVWSLGGDDAARDFMIDGGVLNFKSPPDYEKPNSKSVGTLADEERLQRGLWRRPAAASRSSVTVTNVDEDGSVSFSGRRPVPAAGRQGTGGQLLDRSRTTA